MTVDGIGESMYCVLKDFTSIDNVTAIWPISQSAFAWEQFHEHHSRKLDPSSLHLEMILAYVTNHAFSLPSLCGLQEHFSEEQKVYASPFLGLLLFLLIHHLKSSFSVYNTTVDYCGDNFDIIMLQLWLGDRDHREVEEVLQWVLIHWEVTE